MRPSAQPYHRTIATNRLLIFSPIRFFPPFLSACQRRPLHLLAIIGQCHNLLSIATILMKISHLGTLKYLVRIRSREMSSSYGRECERPEPNHKHESTRRFGDRCDGGSTSGKTTLSETANVS